MNDDLSQDASSITCSGSHLNLQKENAISESEERFSKAFHASPVATAITKLEDGLFIDVNESFLKMTGYARHEVIGRTSRDLLIWSSNEERGRFLKRLLDENSIRDYERVIRTKDDQFHTTLLSAEVIDLNRQSCVLLMMRDITEAKRNEERIRTYQKELRSLASQLTLAEERERRRIGTTLHDHIGQTLAMIKIRLGALQKSTSPEIATELQQIRELLEQSLQSVRSLSFELSPPILYDLGLEAAVEWLTEQTQKQHGIQVEFENDGRRKHLSDPLRVLLFTAIRELLVNTVKHSRATSARVSMEKFGDDIRITISDNGTGFRDGLLDAPMSKMPGLGLFSIRERISHLGGRLEIESSKNQGSQLTLIAPLESESNMGV
jgi:PAS domain S-box-containing protein